MAVIAPCVYDAHEVLQAPAPFPRLQAEARLAFRGTAAFPTLDIGYTHVFRRVGYGRTYAEAKREADVRLTRFFRKLSHVEGFVVIAHVERDNYLRLSGGYSVTHDITYAIERTGNPAQEWATPYPEYDEDVSKLIFPPETAAVLAH